jgi:LL-diaminopimelate aminotransferase
MMPRYPLARRLSELPPYLFAEIDRMKQEAIRKGVDIINLGVGDPDLPTPPHIVEALAAAGRDPANHPYPSYEGMLSFRQAAADWYRARFGVSLDAKTEVLSLIGSKEGIGHLPLAFVDPGDVVLAPDPGYPVYQAGTAFAAGTVHYLPLTEDRKFLPDLEGIPADVLRRAKILWLNFPHNPTAAVAPPSFFDHAVEFARRHHLILCHDIAYSEIYFDGERPQSLLTVDGAKEVAVEFHSLSKTYNMTGWRIGFAVGCAEVLAGLGRIKTNLDSGIFQAVQVAGIAALTGPQDCVEEHRRIWQQRRDAFVKGLRELDCPLEPPKASFYVWIPVPKGQQSAGFTARLLRDCGIVTTPGVGFGRAGEGYIRATLTTDVKRLEEAVERMRRAGVRW